MINKNVFKALSDLNHVEVIVVGSFFNFFSLFSFFLCTRNEWKSILFIIERAWCGEQGRCTFHFFCYFFIVASRVTSCSVYQFHHLCSHTDLSEAIHCVPILAEIARFDFLSGNPSRSTFLHWMLSHCKTFEKVYAGCTYYIFNSDILLIL